MLLVVVAASSLAPSADGVEERRAAQVGLQIAKLVVAGDLVFGNGCTLSATGLDNIPTEQTYTVASADSITGLASVTTLSERGRTWKFALSGDGKSIELSYIPQGTAIVLR